MSGPRSEEDCIGCGKLSRTVHSRSSGVGQGIQGRRSSQGAETDAGGTAKPTPKAEPTGDGRPRALDQPAVRRAAGGTKLRPGQGAHVSAATLERVDSFSAARRSPAG